MVAGKPEIEIGTDDLRCVSAFRHRNARTWMTASTRRKGLEPAYDNIRDSGIGRVEPNWYGRKPPC
jgi:hypothetical protein